MARWIAALMTGTALLPSAAGAQTAAIDTDPVRQSETASGEASDDIIVTAQRFEQRLQDVPISVSVIGAKELEARSVASLADMQYSVPGLSSFEYGPGRESIQLRGISNTIGSSTVGTYFDETPLGLDFQPSALSIRLLDLERVEVLRGPQATLYGQGSMGGTIRYIPAAPRLDTISGSVEAEYSGTEDGASNYKAVGVLNLPLSTDIAGLRLVAGYERVGGYIDNAVTGEKNVNSTDIYTVRGSLLVKPTDRLSISLLGMYQKADQANQDFAINRRSSALLPSPNVERYTLIQGKLSYELDFAELSGSASYIDRRSANQNDVSSYLLPPLVAPPPLGFGLPIGFIDRIGFVTDTDFSIYNSEIRLASFNDGPFTWQVGATYRDMKTHSVTSTFTAPGALPFALLESDDRMRSRSYAVYGEVGYAFTPQLKAIVGLRYFSDRKERDVVSTSFGFATTDVGDGTFNSVNPRFNLTYEFSPDSMVFANVAKGFRGGGFNLTSAGGGVYTIPPTYDSDEIWTYEIGTKHQLFDKKLILDASVYRSEWSKVQSYALVPGSVIYVVNNSGNVSGWGVDIAATARPTRTLTLSATYGWNNLEFKNATGDKLPGDPVDGAVRESYSAALDFRPPFDDNVTGIFRIDYQHAGKGQITLRNFGGQIVPRPGRDLVNLRLGATTGPVEVALFVDNLFDEDAPNIIGPLGVLSENLEQRPRVIGINARMDF